MNGVPVDLARSGVRDDRLQQFRWQLEELRVVVCSPPGVKNAATGFGQAAGKSMAAVETRARYVRKGSILDLVFVTSVFWRSLAAVRNPALWKLLAIPVAVATGSLIVLLLLALQPLATQFLGLAPATWLVSIGWTGVADIFLGRCFVGCCLQSAMALAALVSGLLIVGQLTAWLGKTADPQLRRHGSDRTFQSAWISAYATLVYLDGWLFTLPLWLVPGLAFVPLPVGWLALVQCADAVV